MKVGIMQPYFMPYIGYWQLMNAVDRYVIYDDVNYINRGWIHRNRILMNGAPIFFNVPMFGASQNKLINEIKVNTDEALIVKNRRTIQTAYRKAPCYKTVYPILEAVLTCKKENIAEYIAESFKIINAYLGIETELIMSSTLKKDCSLRGQDKVLAICEELGATEYYNAIGGQELYSFSDFAARGIKLSFLKMDPIEYKQFGKEFQPNLSIIDVMMFNDRDEIRKMLTKFSLVTEKAEG